MTPTALVVDDAPDIRFLVREVLERAGCTVLEAESGPAALGLLRDGPLPDVVVLDVQMPDMDGWETLTRLRGDARTRPLPVVLCTVKSSPADVARAWHLGCDGYLTKPFAIADLVDEVLAVAARTDDERVEMRRQRQLAALAALDPV